MALPIPSNVLISSIDAGYAGDSSLYLHPRRYRLSCFDCFLSVCGGLSGLPFAYRHWTIGETLGPFDPITHTVIAIVEAIPLVGAIAALVERVVFAIWGKFSLLETAVRKNRQD